MSEYVITVGETGNNIGYVSKAVCNSDAQAISKARRLVRPYKGDGWYKVQCGSDTIARGGRH